MMDHHRLKTCPGMIKQLLLVVLLFCKLSNAEWCTDTAAAEGSPFSVTKYVKKSDVPDGILQWEVKQPGGIYFPIVMCDISKNTPCTSISPSLSGSTMVLTSGNDYKMTLDIESVSRRGDQRTWFIGVPWSGTKFVECDLPVYSFQSPPVCNNHIQISTNGKTVTWTCTVDKVYPRMDCMFSHRRGSRGSFQSVSSGYIVSGKTTTPGNPSPSEVYHNYTCTMNLPISNLGTPVTGNYQFTFTAVLRVDVNGGSKTHTQEKGPKTLTLAFPEAELINCQEAQGYIKEGVIKTCGCRIKTQGNPSGVPVWQDSNGKVVGGTVTNGVTLLAVKYDSNGHMTSWLTAALLGLNHLDGFDCDEAKQWIPLTELCRNNARSHRYKSILYVYWSLHSWIRTFNRLHTQVCLRPD